MGDVSSGFDVSSDDDVTSMRRGDRRGLIEVILYNCIEKYYNFGYTIFTDSSL